MVRKLIILSLTLICLTGFASAVHAQEGNPEEFGKKVNTTESDNEEVNQEEPDNTNSDTEEAGSLKPVKYQKFTPTNFRHSSDTLNPKEIKKEGNLQTAPKAKKYNILLYYFYKSKYEETDSKEETDASTSSGQLKIR